MRNVKVAAVQMRCVADNASNIELADTLIRQAASEGARIILLQELFESLYFCQNKNSAYHAYATPLDENRAVCHFTKLAKELQVVLPVSFYERDNNRLFNTAAIVDADGTILGTYRKSHIPDGPGYEETFYFSPGDSGFKVWETRYAKIGVGICWDQWFPEAARCMVLMGAELLLYPTAIGSEPHDPGIDSKGHWQTCMLGHAAANMVPVVASNRTGVETDEDSTITFYGSSFIAGPFGNIVTEAERTGNTVLTATFDLDKLAGQRRDWGLFKDRRPDLYETITDPDRL